MYKVVKENRGFYVMPFDVETYIRSGFDLYKETERIIDDVENELIVIEHDANAASLQEYYARKNGIVFQVQPFRIGDFYNRGYDIFTKTMIKIDDPYSEIDLINASDDILPL